MFLHRESVWDKMNAPVRQAASASSEARATGVEKENGEPMSVMEAIDAVAWAYADATQARRARVAFTLAGLKGMVTSR